MLGFADFVLLLLVILMILGASKLPSIVTAIITSFDAFPKTRKKKTLYKCKKT